jgi:hypothetical protein
MNANIFLSDMQDYLSVLSEFLRESNLDIYNNKVKLLIKLSSLTKVGYVNNAAIHINDSNPNRVSFHLVGEISGEQYNFSKDSRGVVYISKLWPDSAMAPDLNESFTSSFKGKNFWQIHAPGFRDGYKGLGYGTDIYLSAIKYVTELGDLIISGSFQGGSRTDDAVSIHEKLEKLSGVESREVTIAHGADVAVIELTEDRKRLISSITDNNLNPLNLESLKLSPSIINTNQEFFGLKTDEEISVSIGNVLWGTNPGAGIGSEDHLGISIPVKIDEGESDPRRQFYTNKKDEYTDITEYIADRNRNQNERDEKVKIIRQPPEFKEEDNNPDHTIMDDFDLFGDLG